jgi:ATP-dependent Clp protease ATP-binding subunit ClpA
MPQRLTARAEHLVELAGEAVGELGDSAIRPEHLLYAAGQDPQISAAMSAAGVGAADVRPLLASAATGPADGDAKLDSASEAVLVDAALEAEAAGSEAVDPGHILLALARLASSRQPPGIAELLARLEVGSDRLAEIGQGTIGERRQMPRRRAFEDESLPEASREVLRVARHESEQLGSEAVGSEHLLLALALQPEPAGEALRAVGLDANVLRVEAAVTDAVAPDDVIEGGMRSEARQALEELAQRSHDAGLGGWTPEGLLAELIGHDGIASAVLHHRGLDAHDVYRELDAIQRGAVNDNALANGSGGSSNGGAPRRSGPAGQRSKPLRRRVSELEQRVDGLESEVEELSSERELV